MHLRFNFERHAVSLAMSVALLSACGGGGDTTLAPIDIAGVWVGDESASGGASGLLLSVGDTAYGYETVGTTLRYFKGSAYSSDGVNYTFGTSRYDETVAGSAAAVATVSGQLIGKFVDGSAPRRLFVTYAASANNSFFPMRMDTPAANVVTVADLREFTGSFALPAGSLTLAASSASAATLRGIGVNGCSVSGTLSLPRADRNVWAVRLNQSACTDATRNGIATNGLAMLYKSGATLNIALIGEDGRAWTLVSSSRKRRHNSTASAD
jgi:hypothetical protein